MHEDTTWFDYLPGYHNLELYFKHYLGRTWSNSIFPPQEHFSITHLILTIIVFLFLIIMGVRFYIRAKRPESVIPSDKLTFFSFFDLIFDWIYGLALETLEDPKDVGIVFSVAAGIFIYILFANFIGLIPGLEAPSMHLQFNLSMAIVVFVLTHYFGIKKHKFAYIKQFLGDVWYMSPLFFVLEIISHLARPLSLTVRLLGNMFADHKIVGLFSLMFPLILPLPFMFLGLFVAFLQAGVFMMLAIIYFSLAMSEEH